MASETQIANMALLHLGSSKEISNVRTDRAREAKLCRRFFDISRDDMIRDFPWPFTKRYVSLGLLTEDGVDDDHPTSDWKYSYRYPSDCLFVRRIVSGLALPDQEDTFVPYEIGGDETEKIILTHQKSAIIEYSKKITNPQQFHPDFTIAMSYKLAGFLAPALTGGDPFNLSEFVIKMFSMAQSVARARALNEQAEDKLPISILEKSRL